MLRHVDWGVIKCLVIAGPGFVKDQFKQYLETEAVRRDIRCRLSSLPDASKFLQLLVLKPWSSRAQAL